MDLEHPYRFIVGILAYMNTPIRAMTVLRSTIKDQRVGGGPISKNLCSFPTKNGILPHSETSQPIKTNTPSPGATLTF